MAHELINNTLNGLREYLPVLLANIPAVAAMAPVNEQRLQQVEAHFIQRLDAINKGLLQQIAATNQAITEMRGTIAMMNDTISYNCDLAHARAFNASAGEGTSELKALPLPNGADPPPGEFPQTVNDFRALRGPQLTALINLYALPLPASIVGRQILLAEHCCIRLQFPNA